MIFGYAPTLSAGARICGLCKTLYGATCCESKVGEGPRFPMTANEAERLSRYLQVPVSQAVDIREVSASEQHVLLECAGEEIAEMVLEDRGLYLPMVNGACKYLGPRGCTVVAVKPRLCALFPFAKVGSRWTTSRWVRAPGFCLGVDGSQENMQQTMTFFGTSSAKLDQLWDSWRQDRVNHAKKFVKIVNP